MCFYFSPLFSNSFLPKEKGERRCKGLSEAKVPDFIGIQKKAMHGKQADACLLPPGEGVYDANRRRMRGFSRSDRKTMQPTTLVVGKRTLFCPEIDFEVKSQKW